MFSRRSRQTHGRVALATEYPHRLSLYATSPAHELSVEEFETHAWDRLQLLKALEAAQIRNKENDDLRNAMEAAERKWLPLVWDKADSIKAESHRIYEEQRKKDNTSHFILRLAYAKSEDLQAWLVRQETLLFRLRLERADSKERTDFFNSLNLQMQLVDDIERENLLPHIRACLPAHIDVEHETLYKVNWENVPDLVAQRKVFLKGGYAYITPNELKSLVVNDFKYRLQQGLLATAKFLPRMDEDERLQPVLSNLSKQSANVDQYITHTAAGKITADEVDSLSTHFPLCMRHLNNKLKSDAHLRHGGRMQFGLFLKGIGLPIDEALRFWRKSFNKMTDDHFQKNYAYNIRHNYGMEGKRANYTPYKEMEMVGSCMRIITSNAPSVGDHHGCPFRHFSIDNLRMTMHVNGVKDEIVLNEISEKVKGGHYQVACTRFFEATRLINQTSSKTEVEIIEHPNRYFEMSYKGIGLGSTSATAVATALNSGEVRNNGKDDVLR